MVPDLSKSNSLNIVWHGDKRYQTMRRQVDKCKISPVTRHQNKQEADTSGTTKKNQYSVALFPVSDPLVCSLTR